MAWDKTKPVASSLLSSAELRANFNALQASLSGRNWVADPGHYIWHAETGNGTAGQTVAPSHFAVAGTGAVMQRCGAALTDTTDYTSGGFAAELTYGSSLATFYQNLMDGTIPAIIAGQSLTMGAAVWCASGSAARLYITDSVTGATYSSYHTGGSTWEWLTIPVHEIGASTTGIQAGLEVASSTAYIQGETVLLGDVVPLYPIPAEVVIGTYGIVEPGTPGSAAYAPMKIRPARPFLFTGATVSFGTAPSGGTYVANVRRYDGSAWQDMLASDLSVSDGHEGVASNTVDTVYRYRCLNSFHGATTATVTDDTIRGYTVTNAGSAAGITFHIRGIQFNRPQDALVAFNDASADGS